VVSSEVYDGLPEEIRPACEVADSADHCAERIVALLALPPEVRRQRARTARLEPLEWPRRLIPMIGLIDELEKTQFDRTAHACGPTSSS
jgi:hypothetical protein